MRLRGVGRIAVALCAAAIGISGLVACGNGSGATDSGASVADPAGFPRTVDTVMGPVKIGKAPKRVVVLDTAELDSATLLGVKPVGAVIAHTRTQGGFPDYLAGKVDGITDVGPLLEPNLERIASLRPDLILSSKVRHEKVYAQLSGIAPTVFTETTGSTWKENLVVHAKALGLEQQAADAMKRYADQARALGAAIKSGHGGTLPTVSVVRFLAGPTRIYLSNSFSGTVLGDIGLPRPASQVSTDPKTIMRQVSPEQIDQADADFIFVATTDDPGKTQKGTYTTSPIWRDLPAVKGNRVIEVPDETWMSGIGVQAAGRMLDDVAKATGTPFTR
ncbi:iron-siderophore ABC transporter substrate-binding protein [Nocardia panacis]|uniref:Iron-siderophore ABC transporter substrate-binding protein n=1 Tax=Nocardia panacis TaxID=2340916 RepID=A0A3A4KA20_9NOCA|nr:iron-siderophore ABC transporter substrate-binding protein [Nocardia panacis]RJO74845.1 iron-siderophore ABC transporter substrate-binding protein [Nocardia panacis]